MLEQLHQWIVSTDFKVWYHINCLWRSDFLDTIMPYLRNQYLWVPLYLFFLVFMVYNYGWRGLAWCAGFLLCFAFADFISASMIKPFVHRTRPCNDPRLVNMVYLIVPRSSGLSFPSSHAANHFAMGTYIAITLHRVLKWIWPIPLLWAVAISYAQIYVGVHFPLDVLCGGALGALIGWLVSCLYHIRFTLARNI